MHDTKTLTLKAAKWNSAALINCVIYLIKLMFIVLLQWQVKMSAVKTDYQLLFKKKKYNETIKKIKTNVFLRQIRQGKLIQVQT